MLHVFRNVEKKRDFPLETHGYIIPMVIIFNIKMKVLSR